MELSSYMAVSYVRALVEYVREQQWPVQSLLEVLSLSESQLHDNDLLINAERLNAAFEWLEKSSGSRNIGMQLGQRMRPNHLGVLGLMLVTCDQSTQVFDLHARYGKLISNATWPEYTLEDNAGCLTLHVRKGAGPISRHRIEYSLSGWIQLTRWLLGSGFQPLRIEFSHERPKDISEQNAFFDCELSFSNALTRVYFPPEYMDANAGTAFASMRGHLESQARLQLMELQGRIHGNGGFTEKVREWITGELPYGVPELQKLARKEGLSTRSLQRKLASESVTFKDVIDDVRRELSHRHLSNPDLSLVDVAFMLGYSDQSAFQKAFRRWHHCAPGEYRNRQKKQSR